MLTLNKQMQASDLMDKIKVAFEGRKDTMNHLKTMEGKV